MDATDNAAGEQQGRAEDAQQQQQRLDSLRREQHRLRKQELELEEAKLRLQLELAGKEHAAHQQQPPDAGT